MRLTELKAKSEDELRELAGSNAASSGHIRKHELLVDVLKTLGRDRTPITGDGILEVLSDGFGFLRSSADAFHPGPTDIYVSPSQIRRFDLRTGDAVEGAIRAPKDGERYFALLRVEAINGCDPEARQRIEFDDLDAQRPTTRLELDTSDHRWLRVIDAIAPIGRGQRTLVSGPATQSTDLAVLVGKAIAAAHSDLTVLSVMLEVRPEDLYPLQKAELADNHHLLACPLGETPLRCAQIGDMALARARRLVENGSEVVLVLDNLASLLRAKLATRTPESPSWAATTDLKALLASARRCEDGRSLTLVAVVGDGALAETGALAAANSTVSLALTPGGSVEVDPSGTRNDRPEDLVADGEVAGLKDARARLSREGAGAADKAVELAGAPCPRAELIARLAN